MELLPEPEELAAEPEVLPAEPAGMLESVGSALSRLLPDLVLRPLLSFLPDVRLKQDLSTAAVAALAIDVQADGGLARADAALGPVRDQLKLIEQCFDGSDLDPGPTALAFRLHKRLTGLRADFKKPGTDAVETVGRRILDEQRRLKQVAEDDRRRIQAEADRLAREAAQRAADEARKSGAPKDVVKDMAAAAKTATAPPVAARSVPKLANTTVGEKWKARLAGTAADAEPNPETKDMTVEQRKAQQRLHQAIFGGRAPLLLMDVNWGFANGRADSDKATFDIPGLEAFDAGQVRAKPRR